MEGVERALAAHPAHAPRVRARLAELARLGLLGEEREAREPDRIGPYRILARLGQGGMGTVWLAQDERLGRRVALKAAQVAFDDSGRARQRFEREVRAFAQLSHPCIVPILDVGEAHGRPYFTMEYVEGATLARVVEELGRRRLPLQKLTGEDVRRVVLAEAASEDAQPTTDPDGVWSRTYVETVCRIVLEIADALAHAHAHGVVHRDVKPSNVLVRRDGRAQLFDLGLAHLADQPALTRSGDLAGTPYYLSPEQAAGKRGAVDRRTDVYSLGVTLFELLTLTRPFTGSTTQRVLEEIQRREPPLVRSLNPGVPADLETLCLTALEKDPARRFQTAEAFAADLRRFLSFEPVRARPIGRMRRAARFVRRNPTPSLALALALLVLVGLPAGLLWANARVRDQRDLARAAADEARQQARVKSRVTDFLVELWAPAGELERGREPSAREFLQRGAARTETDFADEPLVRAALMEAVGRAQANLGLHAEALPLLDRAFALRQRELGEAHPEVAEALATLAEVHLAAGNEDAALALARRSLAVFAQSGEEPGLAAIGARVTLAEAAARLGDPALAEEELERALALKSALEGESAPGLADLLERLAELARARGALDRAVERLERALGIRESALAPDPIALARGLGRLVELQRARGDLAAAERAERAARELEDRLARRADGATAAELPALTLDDLRPTWHESYRRSFQEGITALQSGRHREAIAAFERCLGWKPDDPVCAYNTACAWALLGDSERGIAWLERAVENGFGGAAERIEVARKDADVELLRADPRWPAILERMRARAERVRSAATEPRVRIPPSRDGDGELPLLVVLHAEGGTPDDVVEGPWGALADELGLFLLAPAGALPSGPAGRAGFAWYEELDDLARRPLESEERVLAAVRAAFEHNPIDPRRVLIAGERSAAPLAFDLAVRAPGLFRGALLVDGPPLPSIAEDRTRAAALLGLRVELALEQGERPWPGTLAADELLERGGRWLEQRGLASSAGPAGAVRGRREALTRLLAPYDPSTR